MAKLALRQGDQAAAAAHSTAALGHYSEWRQRMHVCAAIAVQSSAECLTVAAQYKGAHAA